MKNVEWGTFHITVNKIGRKWVHVTIPRSNGYKLEATVDISDTETGKKMINDENNKKLQADLKHAYEKACQDLEYAIRSNGSIYTYEGDNISVDDIPGETILDTFNVYGGGIIIRYTEDTVWLIINNGSDGDAWERNNLRTGGAGAYAFRTSLESVKDILQTFLERKKACH